MTALTEARARATVAVSDLDRARDFYRDTLGLTLESELPGVTTFRCGDGTILDVYQSEFAGTAKSTVASFQLPDLASAMADLRGRGVAFETYDSGPMKTVDGVVDFGGVRGAWFRDPDGNILGLIEMPG